MPFSSPRTIALHDDAVAALADDEQVFVCFLKYGHGILGDTKATQSGWLPEIGACIAAVEEAGWQLDHLTDGTTDNSRECLAVFRRSLR